MDDSHTFAAVFSLDTLSSGQCPSVPESAGLSMIYSTLLTAKEKKKIKARKDKSGGVAVILLDQ